MSWVGEREAGEGFGEDIWAQIMKGLVCYIKMFGPFSWEQWEAVEEFFWGGWALMTRCLSEKDNPRAVWRRVGGQTEWKPVGAATSWPLGPDTGHCVSWLSLNSAGQGCWVSTLGVFLWVASVNHVFMFEWVPGSSCLGRLGNQRTWYPGKQTAEIPTGDQLSPWRAESQHSTFEGLGSGACIHSFSHSFGTNLA
uniref:Uncharacterized protein n=1 Tax=Molossus molossus TaxID=27622 RepID=A0A7J8EE11_MOLMO|nr:hypothetical protein HJG59_008828 [Molossus molossus]